jgi:hypothetical protein
MLLLLSPVGQLVYYKFLVSIVVWNYDKVKCGADTLLEGMLKNI